MGMGAGEGVMEGVSCKPKKTRLEMEENGERGGRERGREGETGGFNDTKRRPYADAVRERGCCLWVVLALMRNIS